MFTRKYTEATVVTVTKTDGWNYISIDVDSTSSAPATILGADDKPDGGTLPNPADIGAGKGLSLLRQNAFAIEFVLTIPSGCIVNFVAY